MAIRGWGNVLFVIRRLKKIEENGELVNWCEKHKLPYVRIKNFLDVAYEIIEGNSDLANAIMEGASLLDQIKLAFMQDDINTSGLDLD